MEKQKFEDSLKNAFKDAGLPPADFVWTGIELELEKDNGRRITRKLLFYRMLAAASVVFGLSIGGVLYYQQRNFTSTAPVENVAETSEQPGTEAPGLNENSSQNNLTPENNAAVKGSSQKASTPENNNMSVAPADENGREISSLIAGYSLRTGKKQKSITTLTPFTPSIGFAIDPQKIDLINPSILSSDSAQINNQGIIISPLLKTGLANTQIPELILHSGDLLQPDSEKGQAEKRKSNLLWASIGLAAGSFNPVTTGSNDVAKGFSNDPLDAIVNSSASNQANASGSSYGIGINVGLRLAKRWNLQGGINYLTQNADFTSSIATLSGTSNLRLASFNEYANSPQSSFVITAPYTVNSVLQFIGVPVQAGYLILDRKFGIQFLGGISTDLFLTNSLTPELENISRVTQPAGEDSPFRTLNFSGLLSSEFSYRLKGRYSLALNPGLRLPLQSIYKSEFDLKISPLAFNVGLSVKYIFK